MNVYYGKPLKKTYSFGYSYSKHSTSDLEYKWLIFLRITINSDVARIRNTIIRL